MRRVSTTNLPLYLYICDSITKALTEHFLQENVPFSHLLPRCKTCVTDDDDDLIMRRKKNSNTSVNKK